MQTGCSHSNPEQKSYRPSLFVLGHSSILSLATKFSNAVNEDVRVQKDALENLNTQENIKKDSNRYFAENFWKILNFISQI